MATAAPASPNRWLFGPAADLLLGCGLLYAFVLAAFAWSGPSLRAQTPAFLLPLLVLLVSAPHYGGTLVRVYEHRADRHSYVIFSLWATLLVLAFFVAAIFDGWLASALITLYLTWSPWHYTGQNYGIAVMFLRRRGVAFAGTAKRWLYASFVLSFALTFLLAHGSFGPAVYGADAPVEGEITFLSLGIPVALTNLLFPLAAGAYLVSLAVTVVLLRRGGSFRDLAPSLLLCLTQSLWFGVPFAARYWDLRTGIEPIDEHLLMDYRLFIAFGHAAQYLWVTTYYARASRRWSGYSSYLGKTLLAGVALWTLPIALFSSDALGRIEYGAGLALLIAAAVNVHHFILDGAIWKLRNHKIANVLIRSAPADAAGQVDGRTSAWIRRGVWGTAAAALTVALFAFWVGNFGYGLARARGDLATEARLLEAMAWVGRDSSKHRMQLGRLFERSGDREGALHHFTRAAALAPGAEPELARAWVFARAGQWQAAAEAFEASLAFAPEDTRVALRAARARLRAGEPARARELLDQVAATASKTPALERILAKFALELGDPGDAVRHYREALALEPEHLDSANDLAWLLATSRDAQVRDPEESIRLALQVLGAQPEPDSNAFDTLAAAYAAAGRFPEAIDAAARALELAKRRGEAGTLESIEQRLALYRGGRAYVDAEAPTSAGS